MAAAKMPAFKRLVSGAPLSSKGASANMMAAQTAPLKAITAPLDRSMPPVMIIPTPPFTRSTK